MWAVCRCSPEVVAVLLGLGADANHVDSRGLTPLMCTGFPLVGHVLHGTDLERVKVAALLIRHGANVNQRSGSGKLVGDGATALHFAATSKNPYLVRLLLSSGANLSLKTNQGYTALDMARFPDFSPNDEVVKLLNDQVH
jgi:ankyrin repeat protein